MKLNVLHEEEGLSKVGWSSVYGFQLLSTSGMERLVIHEYSDGAYTVVIPNSFILDAHKREDAYFTFTGGLVVLVKNDMAFTSPKELIKKYHTALNILPIKILKIPIRIAQLAVEEADSQGLLEYKPKGTVTEDTYNKLVRWSKVQIPRSLFEIPVDVPWYIAYIREYADGSLLVSLPNDLLKAHGPRGLAYNSLGWPLVIVKDGQAFAKPKELVQRYYENYGFSELDVGPRKPGDDEAIKLALEELEDEGELFDFYRLKRQ